MKKVILSILCFMLATQSVFAQNNDIAMSDLTSEEQNNLLASQIDQTAQEIAKTSLEVIDLEIKQQTQEISEFEFKIVNLKNVGLVDKYVTIPGGAFLMAVGIGAQKIMGRRLSAFYSLAGLMFEISATRHYFMRADDIPNLEKAAELGRIYLSDLKQKRETLLSQINETPQN